MAPRCFHDEVYAVIPQRSASCKRHIRSGKNRRRVSGSKPLQYFLHACGGCCGLLRQGRRVRSDDRLDVNLGYQRKIRDGELIIYFRAAIGRYDHIAIATERRAANYQEKRDQYAQFYEAGICPGHGFSEADPSAMPELEKGSSLEEESAPRREELRIRRRGRSGRNLSFR